MSEQPTMSHEQTTELLYWIAAQAETMRQLSVMLLERCDPQDASATALASSLVNTAQGIGLAADMGTGYGSRGGVQAWMGLPSAGQPDRWTPTEGRA